MYTSKILVLALTLAIVHSLLIAEDAAIRENSGQIVNELGVRVPEVLYYSTNGNTRLYFHKNRISYVVSRTSMVLDTTNSKSIGHEEVEPEIDFNRFDVEFINSNADSKLEIKEQLTAYNNYYLSHCPNGVNQVFGFKQLTYKNVWNKIDAVFKVSSPNSTIEFIVHPGGDYRNIRLKYIGADSLNIDAKGNLVVITALGIMTESKPVSFNESTTPIETAFQVIGNNEVRYSIAGSFDRKKELLIDPTQQWSTFFGGVGNDQAHRAAVDKNSNILIIGRTISPMFPTKLGFSAGLKGKYDATITKFNSDGKLVWSTFFGGSGAEIHDYFHCDLTVDSKNSVIVSGCTESADLPIKNAMQETFANSFDVFVAKFDEQGTLEFSTFCGGNDIDEGFGITTDKQDNIILTGYTSSRIFPLSSNATVKFNTHSGSSDGYLIKFDSKGKFVWAQFIGNNLEDKCLGVVCDKFSNIWVTGETLNKNLGFSRIIQQRLYPTDQKDGFVAKYTAGGTNLWGTFYSGNLLDTPKRIALDSNSTPNCIIIGETESTLLPNLSLEEQHKGVFDTFIAKFDNTGGNVWSKYYGGRGQDRGNALAIDPDNNLLICGETSTEFDLPILGGFQKTYGGRTDGFIAKYSSEGVREWSTYLGGKQEDKATCIAVDKGTNFVVVGFTQSEDFPITSNAFQSKHADSPNNSEDRDFFISKMCNIAIPRIRTNDQTRICKGQTIRVESYTLTSVSYNSYQWFVDGKAVLGATDRQFITSPSLPDGQHKVNVEVTNTESCPASSDTLTFEILKPPGVEFAETDHTICDGDSYRIRYSLIGSTPTITWKPSPTLVIENGTNPLVTPKVSESYFYIIEDSFGCIDSGSVTVNVVPIPTPSILHDKELVLCEGDSIVLSTQTYSRYEWYPTLQNSQSIVVKESNKYWVKSFTSSGCEGTSEQIAVLFVPKPKPQITIGGLGEPLQTGVFSSYIWLRDGIVIPGETSKIIPAYIPGRYKVVVTNEAGCVGISEEVLVAFTATTVVSIGSASAEVGQRIVLPFSHSSSGRLDLLQASSYTAKISFNNTLLRLDSVSNGSFILSRDANDEFRSFATLSGMRGNTNELSFLSFTTALGNSDSTFIRIDDFSWNASGIQIPNKIPGVFTLLGFCRANGERLFERGSIGLKQIRPNPANSNTQIIFSVLEKGTTSLEIYNEIGSKVTTLLQDELHPGEYTYECNTSSLFSGNYTVVLITPSQKFTVPLVVVR